MQVGRRGRSLIRVSKGLRIITLLRYTLQFYTHTSRRALVAAFPVALPSRYSWWTPTLYRRTHAHARMHMHMRDMGETKATTCFATVGRARNVNCTASISHVCKAGFPRRECRSKCSIVQPYTGSSGHEHTLPCPAMNTPFLEATPSTGVAAYRSTHSRRRSHSSRG